jgi:TRAP transporter TAXI family solute receptor
VLVLVIICGALAYFTWRQYPWLFLEGYSIRIATGPLADDSAKFVTAFKREMAYEYPRVQLVTVDTGNRKASAEDFITQKVDAAVVRSDDPAAADGRTIGIIRKVFVAIVVPAYSPIESVAGLAGKKIGVISAEDEIDPLAKTVLEFLGIGHSHFIQLSQNDVGPAVQRKRVAALIAVGPAGPGSIAETVRVIRTVTKKPPKFLDLDVADAISNRYPVYDSDEIPAGAFVGQPAIPGESVTTIAATVRLVTTPSLSNYAAGELTRLLLVTKAKVASTVPGAGQIEAPDTDLSAVLPVHPGTLAYLNGNQPNLWDESQNAIYTGSLILGVFGSIGAWLAGHWNRKNLKQAQTRLGRIAQLLSDAKSAPADRLDHIETELEQLSEWMTEKFVRGEIQSDDFRDFAARLSHIQAIISKRRGASLRSDARLRESVSKSRGRPMLAVVQPEKNLQ